MLAEGAFGRGRGSRSLLRQALLLPRTRHTKSRFFRRPQMQLLSSQQPGASVAAGGGGGGGVAALAAAAGASRQHVCQPHSHSPAAAAARAVVHDASYWQCLQLQGQQQQLEGLLSRMR